MRHEIEREHALGKRFQFADLRFTYAPLEGRSPRWSRALGSVAGSPSPFAFDAHARRIVGWQVSASAYDGFVLDALEQPAYRHPVKVAVLVHHFHRGSQYLCICRTERLGEASPEPSAGSVGDSCENASVEPINDLSKVRVIHSRGPRRSFEAVECIPLE